jgi:hypothetical protein
MLPRETKMNNPDIEIYIKNFMSFLENNPNELYKLIGKDSMGKFKEKIREQCFKNIQSGDDFTVTRTQLTKIIADMKGLKKKSPFMETKFGAICLN